MEWHQYNLAEVFDQLQSSEKGLTGEEAQARLLRHGPNELVEKKKMPPWMLFLAQFKDFMIIVLMVAAVISGIVGDLTDTVIILVIVFLNAVIGFVQEYRAEKAMEALKKMATLQAQVMRGGVSVQLPSSALVPGDVVLLEAGNAVPADIRLTETHSFNVDESALTGESVPVDKHSESLAGRDIPLGDRLNMAYKSTLITNGRARGVVTSTGMQTEMGKIAAMLQEQGGTTPLQKRMADFGKKLSYLILGICVLLLGVGILRGEEPLKMLLLSISLAVAAIPEALPALITIALARGAKRLVKQQALIRKLPAVETLGSVTFICTDKTGTLTQNKMKVVEAIHEPTPFDAQMDLPVLMVAMALNHDVKNTAGQTALGDPTEIALVEYVVQQHGMDTFRAIADAYERRAELPFDSDRKCMTTVHDFNGRFLVISKGAVESITGSLANGEMVPRVMEKTNALAAEGMRVLAYGVNIIDRLPEPFVYEAVEKDLQFAGVAAMIDPPREEVRQAITDCKTAGIHPVMITGDHPATAASIARQIGILGPADLVLTGAELKNMPLETYQDIVEKVRVYARVSPEQKLQIVKALQQKHHFVSMTGDGVNDAPSLKKADIGVAMGINGTDVSKEAAHMILLDDNFATIVKAVKEGRRIFENIRKFVKYIMTCNSAEIWTIFLAPLIGLPIPLLPIHLLWINLVTDGLPGLALAGEGAERDIMKKPPRKSGESLFSDGIGFHIVWVGLLMAGVTLGAQAWAIHTKHDNWQTIVFTILAFAQLGHVLAIRSDRFFLFQQGIFSNPPLVGAVVLTILLQLGVIYLPFFNKAFRTAPLTLEELLGCVAAAAIVFHAVELEKLTKKLFWTKRSDDLHHPG